VTIEMLLVLYDRLNHIFKGEVIHTGSFPSIASIHSRLFASQRACRVMTPCLQGTKSFHLPTMQQQPYLNVSELSARSHLSTTSMSKQKRLSMDSVFRLTQERSLKVSGAPFTTPFCAHRHAVTRRLGRTHTKCALLIL